MTLFRLAGNDQIEHLPLAFRQALDAFCDNVVDFALRSPLLVRLKAFGNAVQQILVTKRLLDKVDRAFLHGFNSHGYVAVTGDENYGQCAVAPDQFRLQFKATKARHADIENETTRCPVAIAFEEIIAGRKDPVWQVDRLHQSLHRDANRRIVIYNEYGRCVAGVGRHRLRLDQKAARFASKVRYL